MRRGVLLPDGLRVTRSLRKAAHHYTTTVDAAFDRVLAGCADPSRPHGWIDDDIVAVFTALHRRGIVHSVETWTDGELVGGQSCVAVGRAVFGESMFARRTDASKMALAALVAFCRQHGIPQVDCQQNTGHLATLGAAEMPRQAFLQVVQAQQTAPAPCWTFEPLYWKQVLASPAHPDPSA